MPIFNPVSIAPTGLHGFFVPVDFNYNDWDALDPPADQVAAAEGTGANAGRYTAIITTAEAVDWMFLGVPDDPGNPGYPITATPVVGDAYEIIPLAAAVTMQAVDSKIDTLLARTATGVSVSPGTHIAEDGETLLLVQGEALLEVINNALSFPVTDPRLTSAITADGTVPILRIAGGSYARSWNGAVVDFDDESKTATVKWNITKSESDELPPGSMSVWELDWQLAGNEQHSITSVINAPVTVRPQIA